ncbi:MAG: hypothetical protein H7201_06705 [Candidatus Saccharibacteria bacterium]|nr:hypothetical protein [Microbacteriaceae bacterium]
MTPANDEELQVLRKRAYGPNADIHRDPGAFERLRELEGAVRGSVPLVDAGDFEAGSTPAEQAGVRSAEEAGVTSTEQAGTASAPVENETALPAKKRLRPLSRVGRFRLSIALGLAVASIIFAGALVLNQRPQIDPLQAGAREVVRLSVDPSYKVSSYFFGSEFGRDLQAQAFTEFDGLRAVVTVGYGGGSNDACLNLYPSAVTVDPKASSFAGRLRIGCASGNFPPRIQFRADAAGLPADLRSAFPKSAALQFVYDSATNEVVVFAEK